jgi:phospholipid transport system transporter-binding protein
VTLAANRAASAQFEVLSDQRAAVSGALVFSTVGDLLPRGSAAIGAGTAASIDLSAVGASDSAGLALLIEWLSVAHAESKTLRYLNVPAQLHQLAALSDVDTLLGESAAVTKD